MLSRFIRCALFVSVTLLPAGCLSVPSRQSLDLRTRGVDVMTQPPHDKLAVRATDTSDEDSQFIYTWISLPTSFRQCKETFEKHVQAMIAMQAVNGLYSQVKIVSAEYGSGSQYSLDEQNIERFKQIIVQVFTSWQVILQIGPQVYKSSWDSHFRPAFERYYVFVDAIVDLCTGFKIDLKSLLVPLNLDVKAFMRVGINLKGILGDLEH